MTETERRTTFIGHSIVNGLGVLTFGAMHIWGSLSAEMAMAGIAAVCGVWGVSTRKGPPAVPPGASGLLVTAGASLFPKMAGGA